MLYNKLTVHCHITHQTTASRKLPLTWCASMDTVRIHLTFYNRPKRNKYTSCCW